MSAESTEERDAVRLPERDLAAMLERVARGDQEALGALYNRTSASVYGLALHILRDRPAAEEITLDVYTYVYRQAEHYDPTRGAPWAWLLTLTRSRAIDRLRASARQRKREQPLESVRTLSDLTASPEEATAVTETNRAVRAALLALAPEQRRVMEIAYYAGLSHTEIAAMLGEPLGTIKTRIRAAMARLRDLLRSRALEEAS
jgi:RNA polymerase sigma-70 factor (ECF subfamily)